MLFILITIVVLYIAPIISAYLIDYVRCPYGTTLIEFIRGSWYEKSHIPLAGHKELFIPAFNWFFLAIVVCVNICNDMKNWDIMNRRIK